MTPFKIIREVEIKDILSKLDVIIQEFEKPKYACPNCHRIVDELIEKDEVTDLPLHLDYLRFKKEKPRLFKNDEIIYEGFIKLESIKTFCKHCCPINQLEEVK
jgi:hypothetical protein